jgi:hypothetical protein
MLSLKEKAEQNLFEGNTVFRYANSLKKKGTFITIVHVLESHFRKRPFVIYE